MDWRTARIHLKNWSREMARLRPVNYVTMISVPSRHPVFVGLDWIERLDTPPKQLPFVPLCDIERSILVALKQEIGTPQTPEMVLGADLPRRCIKWTKDIRLLMRGDTREKLQKRFDGESG